jgi:hypothetical protein
MEFLAIQNFENYPEIEHDFERNLFNEKVHLLSRSTEGWTYFLLKNQNLIVARTVFKILDQEAINPYRSTFGGIEFSGRLNKSELENFVKLTLSYLNSIGIKSVSLILPPHFIDPNKTKLLESVLRGFNFIEAYKDLNQHIEIDQNTFEAKIIPAQKRRLKKCITANFVFKILDISYLDEYFEMYVASRTRKNYPISLDKASIGKLLNDFPIEFKLMGILDKNKLIAASIIVKVNPRTVYYFLPADHVEYLTYSPMVFLLKSVYDYCQTNHIHFFDLGISSVKGKFPFGFNLANFKENCGAIVSDKREFALKISN